MAASSPTEDEKKTNWFNRTFSSKKPPLHRSSSTSRITSVTNPSFISFSDILRPRRPTEHQSKTQQSTFDQSLVDIAVNAGSDISSLADKSRGTIDFFHTSPVSSKYLTKKIIKKIKSSNRLLYQQPMEVIMLIGQQSIG